MKQLVRRLFRQLGFELIHRSDDAVLNELRILHETLRLEPRDHLRWEDSLPQPAAHANLRHLLQLHRVDLLLDVGANRGQFARLCRRLGYQGEIVSFEPLSRHRAELDEASRRDEHWRVFPLALGSAPAELELHVYQDDQFSSFHAVNPEGQARFQGLVTENHIERVAVRTLDSLWPEISGGNARRVLLKTDTQGHDLAVLNGAIEVLRHTHALVAETALRPIYANAPLFGELVTWLAARGFAVSGVFPISHDPTDLSLIEMDCSFTRRIVL